MRAASAWSPAGVSDHTLTRPVLEEAVWEKTPVYLLGTWGTGVPLGQRLARLELGLLWAWRLLWPEFFVLWQVQCLLCWAFPGLSPTAFQWICKGNRKEGCHVGLGPGQGAIHVARVPVP